MKEYTDGCVYVTARNAGSAAKKIAKVYEGVRSARAREQKSNVKWLSKNNNALYNLCTGR